MIGHDEIVITLRVFGAVRIGGFSGPAPAMLQTLEGLLEPQARLMRLVAQSGH